MLPLVEFPEIVRALLYEVGYTDADMGIDANTCAVISAIQEQSGDIAMGVNIGGAGDQGMMYGYATDETPELMPLPIMLAHRLVRRLTEIRKTNVVNYLHPDGKSQVTIEYKDDKPARVDTIILSVQHHPDVNNEKIHTDIKKLVIEEIVPKELIDDKTKLMINPTGRFVIGGPQGDTGVTGRKIMVDTYGGIGDHGGGCFSGKDPSKVDRSAAYAMRHAAKNVVAARLAHRCEVEVAYAIGIADPVSVSVDTFGTNRIPENEIEKIVRDTFDLTPAGIIKRLKLKRPIYRQTSYHGHFGRKGGDFTWEKTDYVDRLRKAAKI